MNSPAEHICGWRHSSGHAIRASECDACRVEAIPCATCHAPRNKHSDTLTCPAYTDGTGNVVFSDTHTWGGEGA